MAKRVVDVLVPVALDQAYSYRVPLGLELAPGDLVTVPLGARTRDRGGLVGEPKPQSSARQSHEGGRGQARHSCAQAGIAKLRRLGVGLYARSARHGAADGLAHGRASRPRSRAHRRTARGAGAQADDGGAQPRARASRRRACPGQERGRARSRRFAWGHRWSGRRGHAGKPAVAAATGRACAGPGILSAGFDAGPAQSSRHAAGHRRQRRLRGHSARWRHRLRQDASLSGGGRGNHPARPAGAGAGAGNRLDLAIPRPLHRAFRYPTGGVALAIAAAAARTHLERSCRRRSERDRRRALGSFSPLFGSRTDRRR